MIHNGTKIRIWYVTVHLLYVISNMNLGDLAQIKGITFGSINVRSLLPKVDEVGILLERSNLDILCIQEALLDADILDSELKQINYTMHRSDRNRTTCKSLGGGILTYCHSKYKVEMVPDWTVLTRNIEVHWLRLNLKDTRPTYIANTY